MTVVVANDVPVSLPFPLVELSAGHTTTSLDLGRFFTDPDGDPLTYILQSAGSPDVVLAVVEQVTLSMSVLGAGTASLAAKADDAIARTCAYSHVYADADDHAHSGTPAAIAIEPTSTLTPAASRQADASGPTGPDEDETSERAGIPVCPAEFVVAGLLATIAAATAEVYHRLR